MVINNLTKKKQVEKSNTKSNTKSNMKINKKPKGKSNTKSNIKKQSDIKMNANMNKQKNQVAIPRDLVISSEIEFAIKKNLPIVALESTIITHGMPYPENYQTALLVESEVRKNGAIPATIAIVNGKMRVGLSETEIEELARKKGVGKVSRRDLPIYLTLHRDGGTTVSATMLIAALAKIKFFATGGIGGVHRNYTEVLDISADLEEFTKSNVAVICAGVKSILDIQNTLEYLETKGVPVVGFKTREFPAFYSRESGYMLDAYFDSPKDLAQLVHRKCELELDGGILIANPIPIEASMDKTLINTAIEQALVEAKQKGVKGKEITPFLLGRIVELTSGKSLQSNIQLILNNAKLAAQIAVQYVQYVQSIQSIQSV